MDSDQIKIARGYLMMHPNQSSTTAQKNLAEICSALEIETPTSDQVRLIRRTITRSDRTFIRNRMKKFDSKFNETNGGSPTGVIWVIDFPGIIK